MPTVVFVQNIKRGERVGRHAMLRVRVATCNAAGRVAQALPIMGRAFTSRASSSALPTAVASPNAKLQATSWVAATSSIRTMATGPAASPTVVSDDLLAKLGSLSTQAIL